MSRLFEGSGGDIMFHGGEEVMTWIFDEIEKRGGDIEAQEWSGATTWSTR
jgi:hypothetical protein